MSVENTEVVDAIGVQKGTGSVALTISDHLDWRDLHGHLRTLQDKLNRYLAFIESGELLESYPDAKGRAVRIDVYFQHEPSREAGEFLAKAATKIRQAGMSFEWRVLNGPSDR